MCVVVVAPVVVPVLVTVLVPVVVLVVLQSRLTVVSMSTATGHAAVTETNATAATLIQRFDLPVNLPISRHVHHPMGVGFDVRP